MQHSRLILVVVASALSLIAVISEFTRSYESKPIAENPADMLIVPGILTRPPSKIAKASPAAKRPACRVRPHIQTAYHRPRPRLLAQAPKFAPIESTTVVAGDPTRTAPERRTFKQKIRRLWISLKSKFSRHDDFPPS